jgi:hypothetical protein
MIDASVGVPEREDREVELGPFFTAGVLLLVYGLLRRRPLALGAGIGAIWVDQRSELGRNLKRRARSALEKKIDVPVVEDREEQVDDPGHG